MDWLFWLAQAAIKTAIQSSNSGEGEKDSEAARRRSPQQALRKAIPRVPQIDEDQDTVTEEDCAAMQVALAASNRPLQPAAPLPSGRLARRIESLLDEAEECQQKGDWQAAIARYDDILQLQPSHEDALRFRHWVKRTRLGLEDTEGAQPRGTGTSCSARLNRWVDQLLDQAEACERAGNFQEACSFYDWAQWARPDGEVERLRELAAGKVKEPGSRHDESDKQVLAPVVHQLWDDALDLADKWWWDEEAAARGLPSDAESWSAEDYDALVAWMNARIPDALVMLLKRNVESNVLTNLTSNNFPFLRCAVFDDHGRCHRGTLLPVIMGIGTKDLFYRGMYLDDNAAGYAVIEKVGGVRDYEINEQAFVDGLGNHQAGGYGTLVFLSKPSKCDTFIPTALEPMMVASVTQESDGRAYTATTDAGLMVKIQAVLLQPDVLHSEEDPSIIKIPACARFVSLDGPRIELLEDVATVRAMLARHDSVRSDNGVPRVAPAIMNVQCPMCLSSFQVDHVGEVTCENCENSFTLGADGKAVGALLECPFCEESAYFDGEGLVQCPHCQDLFLVNERLEVVGAIVDCPHCGQSTYNTDVGVAACKHCKETFIAGEDYEAVGHEISCPLCGHELFNDWVGERRCPGCNNWFTTDEDFDPIGESVTCPHCGGDFYSEVDGIVGCPHCRRRVRVG